MDDTLASGTRVLERYYIREKIASGGLSVVYRGDDERLPREVCIKVFHALSNKITEENQDSIFRFTYNSFINEAIALSRLNHPNTLRIYDFGYIKDPALPDVNIPVQVSEYMAGGTLSHLIRKRGTLPTHDMLPVASAICGALAEAHCNGIIHLDIKPQNILFFTSGSTSIPKLADFSIAKSIFSSVKNMPDLQFTQDNIEDTLQMYTMKWTSPEQITGRSVGPPSDIYSLGLVIIFILSGKAIYKNCGREEALNQRRASAALVSQTLLPVGIPQPLLEVLQRACNYSRKKRPKDIESFLKELNQACNEETKGISTFYFDDEVTVDLDRGGVWVNDVTPVDPLPQGLLASDSEAHLPDTSSLPSTEESPPMQPRGESSGGMITSPSTPTALIVKPELPQPIRFGVSQQLGGRFITFTELRSDKTDFVIANQGRIRTAIIPDVSGRFCLHIKGVNCFLRLNQGTPSSAIQVKSPASLMLITPEQQTIAEGEIQFSEKHEGQVTFTIGNQRVIIDHGEALWLVALDFGDTEAFRFLFSTPAALSPG